MRIIPGLASEGDIYGLTDSTLSMGRPVEDVVRGMLDGGIKVIQYREKHKDNGEMLAECRRLRELTKAASACFIVNDHVDIAILCGADGVHVGQSDIPARDVRRLTGPDMIIGVSARTPEEARKAIEDGADYLGVGPIYATATKPDAGPGLAFEFLEYCLDNLNIPIVAIGGINRRTIGDVAAHGCKSCAIVSDLVSAPDIAARAAELRLLMHMKGAC